MRTFSLIILVFCFRVVIAQEMNIDINKELTVEDTVCFTISNCMSYDCWFYTLGLGNRICLKDADGEIISPVRKIEANPLEMQEFVLIKANSTKNIFFPIGKVLSQYELKKGKQYYLFFKYENYIKKKRTKIKTYTGKVKIKSLKL